MLAFLSPALRRFALLAAQDPRSPVFICGESGTGRSELAHWIHRNSLRGAEVFARATPDDLALIPPQGSVLVEDIENYPENTQAALLHLGQSQQWVCPPHPPRILGARLFVTSQLPLSHWRNASALSFEENLRWTSCLDIPPLRERQDSFEEIARQLLEDLTLQMGRPSIQSLTVKAVEHLKQRPWKGNLRELREVLRDVLLRTPRNQGGLDLADFNSGG